MDVLQYIPMMQTFFFSNFIWDSGKNTGTSSGKIIIMREESQNKKQLYEIVLNKVRK